VGPPGVGKTSLGKAMASAIGRKFFRISLGGIKDEAEIKGHRRTYIGAMPGKIMQGLKICKTKNPVFMLDEIDKMGVSFQGDPASSLLEVLDPEQNNNFRDHYVDINFDISRVLFITTANTLDSIPPVLLDRMEIIRIPGYLDSEKKEILRKFLLPKQLKKHGLEPSDLKIQQKTALEIIDKYAREAGLRQLERAIEKICRRRAFEKVKKIAFQTEIKTEDLADLLGPVRFSEENIKKAMDPGIVTGLAWTEFGGAILTIEAIGLKGKAGLKLTGHLGEVMKESANIAYSYARRLGTMQEQIGQFLKSHEIHLHIPAGATPKDGPSAGITMALAMVSLASATAVSNTISMTGELTLSGNILPIGGLKEKALAAHRNKIKKVLFPAENIKDLKEIPDYLKKGIKFIPVEKLDEVIDICLPKLIKRK
jgi:ATP-dependent Lon protease